LKRRWDRKSQEVKMRIGMGGGEKKRKEKKREEQKHESERKALWVRLALFK
jgi:hypothetical protein